MANSFDIGGRKPARPPRRGVFFRFRVTTPFRFRGAFPTPLFRSGHADAELLSDSASRRLSDSAARLSDSALPKRPRRRGAPFRLRFSTPFRFRSSEAAAQTRSCFLSDSGSRRLSDSAARFFRFCFSEAGAQTRRFFPTRRFFFLALTFVFDA